MACISTIQIKKTLFQYALVMLKRTGFSIQEPISVPSVNIGVSAKRLKDPSVSFIRGVGGAVHTITAEAICISSDKTQIFHRPRPASYVF